MTPEVTVVDPHHGLLPAAPPHRAALPRRERLLALAIGAVLVVGLAATRTLRAAESAGTATAVGIAPVVGARAFLQLDLVLATVDPVPLRVRDLLADRGWTALQPPPQTSNGMPFSLLHEIDCGPRLRLPSRVRLSVDGTDVVVAVRRGRVRLPDGCDPFAEPLHVVTTSVVRHGSRSQVSVELVNLSTHAVDVSGLRLRGFSFTGTTPLPLTLEGRSRGASLVVADLRSQLLRLEAAVSRCGDARAALDNAVGSGHPDLVALQVSGAEQQVEVPGLESYLEQQWRAACVR